MRLSLLDEGITPANHEGLRRSWDYRPLDFREIKPENRQLHKLQVSGHVNHVTHYRILMPQLPPGEERVVDLDSNLLGSRDFGRLMDDAV